MKNSLNLMAFSPVFGLGYDHFPRQPLVSHAAEGCRPAFVNHFQDVFALLDCLRDGTLPRRAWLGTHFMKFACGQGCCCKQDCVCPLFSHLSPPSGNGASRMTYSSYSYREDQRWLPGSM